MDHPQIHTNLPVSPPSSVEKHTASFLPAFLNKSGKAFHCIDVNGFWNIFFT